jgi:hypothetical protein
MAVNPDPKPGRWILPLVILGMVAFTYFFISALPEAPTDTTLIGGASTTVPEGGSTTTTPGQGGSVDAETQAYLDSISSINDQLTILDTELTAVNAGFDANPREIEYPEAESRMDAVATGAQDLSDQMVALTPPAGLEDNQATLAASIDLAARAAGEALSGLRSTDSGDLRHAAVTAFTSATTDFDAEVQNTFSAAGVSPTA